METRNISIDNTRVNKADFVSAYALLRQRENRLYSNEELSRLPDLKLSDPHYAEWKLRARSANRLIHYLTEKQKSLQILEPGCGNGWLSHLMAGVPNSFATGLDPHFQEIQQAREVFEKRKNLELLAGDFFSVSLPGRYDVIVFAASLQYFPDLSIAIQRCFQYLNDEGEIHILDTQFYREEELQSAALRSSIHFNAQKVPEMEAHYHHHSWKDLEQFQPDLLYTPGKILRFLGFKQNPFPWIRIKNDPR